MAEIGGGGVDILVGGGCPEVQGVAVGVTAEAMEAMLVQVGTEGTAAWTGRAVQRTGAALLRAACGSGRELQESEDLGQGDGSLDGGEVDGRASGRGRLGLGLTQEFAAFASLGELTVAGSENLFGPACELVLGSDVADGAVQANGVVTFEEEEEEEEEEEGR